jgi:alkanesulfonate monooxygenase SsuD/methylene tetrahydromethanopterin reductase-like flavin-dependent oxidoreductase (luciferase family)
MRYGLLLPNAAGPSHPINAIELVALAEAAERAELDSIWVRDRLAIPLHTDTVPTGWREEVLEPIALLTAIATRTKRIAVGTFDCILPLRNPVFLAKAVSTLDCIAAGRLLFGIAEGASLKEFTALGVQDHFTQRSEVTNEWLAICHELWREGDDPSTFEGHFFSFGYIGAYPKPIQKPHPPIYVRDDGPSALIRLATHGSGLILSVSTPSEITAAVSQAREACATVKRALTEIDVCAPLPLDRTQGAAIALDAIAAQREAGVTHHLFESVTDSHASHSSNALEDWLHWLVTEVLSSLR